MRQQDPASAFPGSARGAAKPHFAGARLDREWCTVAAMVRLYCSGKHRTRHGTCPECAALLAYARVRLERCQFGAEKPTCVNCPVHCYAPTRREEMRSVMRYSGPRMLWRHPILTVRHWIDGRVGTPQSQ